MLYPTNKWLFILLVKILLVFLTMDHAIGWVSDILHAFAAIGYNASPVFLTLVCVIIVAAVWIIIFAVHDFVDALLDSLYDLVSETWSSLMVKWRKDED